MSYLLLFLLTEFAFKYNLLSFILVVGKVVTTSTRSKLPILLAIVVSRLSSFVLYAPVKSFVDNPFPDTLSTLFPNVVFILSFTSCCVAFADDEILDSADASFIFAVVGLPVVSDPLLVTTISPVDVPIFPSLVMFPCVCVLDALLVSVGCIWSPLANLLVSLPMVAVPSIFGVVDVAIACPYFTVFAAP